MQSAGAPTWPLAIGDEVIAGPVQEVILFPDGARLTVAPDARVVLQGCDHCVAQLFRGSVDYVKPAESKLELCALGHPLRPEPGTQGSVAIEGDKVLVKVADTQRVASGGKCSCDAGAPWAKGGISARNKALLVIIPAAAAGTAAAVVTSQSSSTSTK